MPIKRNGEAFWVKEGFLTEGSGRSPEERLKSILGSEDVE